MAFVTQVVTADLLADLGWLTGLQDNGAPGYQTFLDFKAKADALPAGEDLARGALRLVAAASILSLNPSSRSRPFGILMQTEDTRSAALEDFGAEDVDSLASIAENTPVLALRARLADVAWEAGKLLNKRHWQSGVTAASAYYQMAAASLAADDDHDGRAALQRGVELAFQFRARIPEVLDQLWRLVEVTARALGDGRRPGLLIFLADLTYERKPELAPTMAPLLEEAAGNHFAASGPTLFHAELWGRASRHWSRAGDAASSDAAKSKEGEAYVAHAEAGAANPMFASHWLKMGLESLRQARADRDRIQQVHHRLLELQQQATDTLAQVSEEIDVRELHAHVMGLVSGKSFEEALFGMVQVDHLLQPDRIRNDVVEQARRHPLMGFMPQELMNERGATIARRGSLLDRDPVAAEAATVAAMYEHAKRWDLHLRAAVMVLRAARTIHAEHCPSEHDVARYVVGHPFVPPQIAVSIIRGLHRGFDGDWLSAGMYLIPRMEWLVRHWMQRAGVITSTVVDGGLQEERSVSQLLELPAASEVLGPQLVFELRCHLTEAWGFNLRHGHAHGLLSDAEVDSTGTISLWWLVWRILLTPVINAAQQRAPADHAAADQEARPQGEPVGEPEGAPEGEPEGQPVQPAAQPEAQPEQQPDDQPQVEPQGRA